MLESSANRRKKHIGYKVIHRRLEISDFARCSILGHNFNVKAVLIHFQSGMKLSRFISNPPPPPRVNT